MSEGVNARKDSHLIITAYRCLRSAIPALPHHHQVNRMERQIDDWSEPNGPHLQIMHNNIPRYALLSCNTCAWVEDPETGLRSRRYSYIRLEERDAYQFIHTSIFMFATWSCCRWAYINSGSLTLIPTLQTVISFHIHPSTKLHLHILQTAFNSNATFNNYHYHYRYSVRQYARSRCATCGKCWGLIYSGQ